MKAISLFSGGLDSILSTRLIIEQGIEVEAVNFTSVFCAASRGKNSSDAEAAADRLGIPLKAFSLDEEYFEVIKNPGHGYGKNVNPCLDCRIFMFSKAKKYMEETGASFIVTGEVLGSRPMSQRRDAIMLIERESGLKGLIVRPLSARLFDPSIPEQKGWVDRGKLLAIAGRGRKMQIQLAEEFGINDYPPPAGGCLLTDKGFSRRMRDLMEHVPDFKMDDVELLKVGRHFRISPDARLAVGRNEQENDRLVELARSGDVILQPTEEVSGPTGIARGSFSEKDLQFAASIIARYSDIDKSREADVVIGSTSGDERTLSVLPAGEDSLEDIRI